MEEKTKNQKPLRLTPFVPSVRKVFSVKIRLALFLLEQKEKRGKGGGSVNGNKGGKGILFFLAFKTLLMRMKTVIIRQIKTKKRGCLGSVLFRPLLANENRYSTPKEYS